MHNRLTLEGPATVSLAGRSGHVRGRLQYASYSIAFGQVRLGTPLRVRLPSVGQVHTRPVVDYGNPQATVIYSKPTDDVTAAQPARAKSSAPKMSRLKSQTFWGVVMPENQAILLLRARPIWAIIENGTKRKISSKTAFIVLRLMFLTG